MLPHPAQKDHVRYPGGHVTCFHTDSIALKEKWVTFCFLTPKTKIEAHLIVYSSMRKKKLKKRKL